MVQKVSSIIKNYQRMKNLVIKKLNEKTYPFELKGNMEKEFNVIHRILKHQAEAELKVEQESLFAMQSFC